MTEEEFFYKKTIRIFVMAINHLVRIGIYFNKERLQVSEVLIV